MQLNLKLLNFNDTFGPRWADDLGRAAQVRIVQLTFAVDAPPPPEGWPIEPDVIFNVATSDPNLLEGIDFSNPDQVYTLDLEPKAAPPGRPLAKGKAPTAHEQKEKAPAHGKESGTTHHR